MRNKLLILLIIIVILLGGYIGYQEVDKMIGNNVLEQTQLAYNLGIQNTVIGIMNEAAKCKSIPLTAENKTINLIAIHCLQN